MAEPSTLSISGEENLVFHHGKEHEAETGKLIENENRRYFCKQCGSPMWSADPRWSEWIYPFTSSVDTALPTPPEIVHIMLDFTAPWTEVPKGKSHRHFKRIPMKALWTGTNDMG